MEKFQVRNIWETRTCANDGRRWKQLHMLGFRGSCESWRKWQWLRLRKISFPGMTWNSCAEVLKVLGAWPVGGSVIDP